MDDSFVALPRQSLAAAAIDRALGSAPVTATYASSASSTKT